MCIRRCMREFNSEYAKTQLHCENSSFISLVRTYVTAPKPACEPWDRIKNNRNPKLKKHWNGANLNRKLTAIVKT